MGANFCDYVFTAANLNEATEKALKHQEAECYENGHGTYGGHLGTVKGVDPVTDRRFASVDLARAYAEEAHGKWSEPLLMRCDGDTWVLAGHMPS